MPLLPAVLFVVLCLCARVSILHKVGWYGNITDYLLTLPKDRGGFCLEFNLKHHYFILSFKHPRFL